METRATQTLVVFIIRTAGNPFRSRPNVQLALAVLGVVAVAFILPFTSLRRVLGFTPMPAALMAIIGALALTYLALVQVVKNWFYRRHELI